MPKPTKRSVPVQTETVYDQGFIAMDRFNEAPHSDFHGASAQDVAERLVEDGDELDNDDDDGRVICQLVPVAIVRCRKVHELVPITAYNKDTSTAVLGQPVEL